MLTWNRKELCHDSSSRPYCAQISDGGCPCSNNEEVKCGGNEYYSGYCAVACCDWTVEEACFDDNNKLIGCVRFDEGGCTNPRQRKIGRWTDPAPFGMHPSPSLGMYPGPSTSNSFREKHPSPQPIASESNTSRGKHPSPSLAMRPRPSKSNTYRGKHPSPSLVMAPSLSSSTDSSLPLLYGVSFEES